MRRSDLLLAVLVLMSWLIAASSARSEDRSLWEIYDNTLKQAKYITARHR